MVMEIDLRQRWRGTIMVTFPRDDDQARRKRILKIALDEARTMSSSVYCLVIATIVLLSVAIGQHIVNTIGDMMLRAVYLQYNATFFVALTLLFIMVVKIPPKE
jgi:uncharacterized membrane protein YcjF (UPF0283 family)